MSGNGIGSFFGNLYENFVARDLTFILGGSVVSASFIHLIDRCSPRMLGEIAGNFVYIIIFVMISYFLGVFCQELFSRIKIVKTDQDPVNEKDVMFLESKAQKEWSFALRRIERSIYIKQIFGVMGSCSLSSVALFVLKVVCFACNLYWGRSEYMIRYICLTFCIFILMLAIGCVCVFLNRKKWVDINGYYDQLNENLSDKQAQEK